MRICDICGSMYVSYGTNATIDDQGNCKELELCYKCYRKLCDNKRHHAFLAYKETVEEMTGETPKKKSWWGIFKKRRINHGLHN